MKLDAIEYPVGSGVYISVGADTDYAGRFLAGANYDTSVSLNSSTRRDAVARLDSISLDGRTLPMLFYRPAGAFVDETDWWRNIKTWFDPAKGRGGPRYLRVLDDSGAALRIPVHLAPLSPRPMTRTMADVTAVAVLPWFEAETASSHAGFTGAAAVTNAGTGRAYPALTIASGGTTYNGMQYVVSDTTGRGLSAFPVCFPKLDSASLNGYGTDVFTIVNGISVANAGNTSPGNHYVVCLVDVPAFGSTTVEVVKASGISNPLANTLDLGKLTGTPAALTATSAQWTSFAVSAEPEGSLHWTPIAVDFETTTPTSWGYGYSESGGTATLTLHNPAQGDANDANALHLEIGANAGLTNALTNLQRVTANHAAGGVRSYVRYRTAKQAPWTLAWIQTADGTVTTALDIDNAVEVIVGIEYTSATGSDGATLALSEVLPSTATALAFTGVAVDSGTAASYRLLNGTIQNTTTGQTITFANVIGPNATWVIDCAADPNTRALTFPTGGTTLGSPSFSDPVDWFGLDEGDNALSNGLGPNLSLSWRDVYG